MDRKDLIALATKFLSRRILALGVPALLAYYAVALPQVICVSVVSCVYIYCVTFGPNKENGGTKKTMTAVLLLIALLLSGVELCSVARADVLPFIDKLDLQIGPGIEIVDVDPVTIDECLLATGKIYERYKLELRVGGLVSDSRRALIFNVARNLSDLILRDDGGEEKTLLPTVGIWFAGDFIRNHEDKIELDFIFGLNAVMAEY